MINLSRLFGAFICTIQIGVSAFVISYLPNFVPNPVFPVVLAVLLGGILIGATQFFDRILGFTDFERSMWISFVPVVGSAAIWATYWTIRKIGESLSQLNEVSGAAGSSLITTYSQASIITPIFLQSGLLVAAYVLIVPVVKADRSKSFWLLLPVIGTILGVLLGGWVSRVFL